MSTPGIGFLILKQVWKIHTEHWNGGFLSHGRSPVVFILILEDGIFHHLNQPASLGIPHSYMETFISIININHH